MLAFLLALVLTFHQDEHGNVFGDIRDLVRALANGVRDVVAWIADDLWDAFQSVAGNVWNAGQNVREVIWSAAGAVKDVVWSAGQNVREVLWDAAVHLRDGIAFVLFHVAYFVADAGQFVGSSVWAAGQNVRDVAWSAAGAVRDTVLSASQNVRGVIWDAAMSVRDVVWSAGQNVREGITDAVSTLVHPIDRVGDAVEHAPEKAVEALAEGMDKLNDALIQSPLNLKPERFADEITAGGQALLDALQFAGSHTKDYAGVTFDEIYRLFTGRGHIEPDEAPGQIAQALALATGVGLASHAYALLKDHVPLLDNTAATHLAGFFSKLSGWDELIEAGFGAMIAIALREPMEAHINKSTRTQSPTELAVREFLGRRYAELPGFHEAMSRKGFTDEWQELLKEASFQELRRFELQMITDVMDLPDNQLEGMIRRARYGDEYVPVLRDALRTRSLSRVNSRIVGVGFDAYRDGFIDGEQFGALLSAARVQPSEQGLWLFAARTAHAGDVKADLVAAWRSAAARGAMTDDELRASLAVIGMQPARADVEVMRANVARLKKPVEEEARTHEKAVNQARANLTAAYRTQFRKGLIDETQLADRLRLIGYEDFVTASIVELARAEKFEPPKPPRGDSPEEVSARARAAFTVAWTTQFQHDLIDAAQLKGNLVSIGVNELEAAAIVLREQARKTPSPDVLARRTAERVAAEVQSTLQAAYVEQFQHDLIDAADLEAALVQIGKDPDAARARRLLEEAKRYETAPSGADADERLLARQLTAARTRAAVEEFRKGLLTPDELQIALVDAGMDPAVAAATVEYELARRFTPATTAPA